MSIELLEDFFEVTTCVESAGWPAPPVRAEGHWYRYDVAYSRVVLNQFKVISQTPKGVWLDVWGTKKFVLRDAWKRYACPTVAEALTSFVARKHRQVNILERQLLVAKGALALAEKQC